VAQYVHVDVNTTHEVEHGYSVGGVRVRQSNANISAISAAHMFTLEATSDVIVITTIITCVFCCFIFYT